MKRCREAVSVAPAMTAKGRTTGDRPEDPQHRSRELAAQLSEASRVLRDDEASLERLQHAAAGLGVALQAAAQDRDLWRRLGQNPRHAGALSETQRLLAIDAAGEIDWELVLDSVGYSGEPPAEELATALRNAVSLAFEFRNQQTAEELRRRLEPLG